MPNRGLDATEAEVVGAGFELCTGKTNGLSVAFFGEVVDGSAAWVTETEHLRHFVVSLSRSVITGPAEINVIADGFNPVKKRVPTGREQSEIGKIYSLFQMNRQQMSFEVVDTDERNGPAKRDSFGKGQPDQE